MAAVYGLMSVVAAGVLPVEDVVGQNLTLVAKEIFSPTLFPVFILGAACCAIASSLAGAVSQLRYPLIAVAEDGWLPPVFKKTTKGGFPYVGMFVFFIFTILPIFTPLSVSGLISMLMIPRMIMNAYMNIALIKLVKKYPEQWKRSILHMSMGLFYVVCVVGCVSALLVVYYLFKDLDAATMVFTLVILAVLFGLSFLRIKTGAVKEDALNAKRERIAEAAIAATEADVAGM